MADDFSLDTSGFNDVIVNTKKMAEEMRDLKDNLDGLKNSLMYTWAGAGRNTFEKKYRLLTQQLGDLKDDLFEMAEQLIEIEQAYIQADTDAAKAADGVSNRY